MQEQCMGAKDVLFKHGSKTCRHAGAGEQQCMRSFEVNAESCACMANVRERTSRRELLRRISSTLR